MGTLIELKQSSTGATIPAVGAFVELATASDHTPFFSSVVLDTFTLPLYTVIIAGGMSDFLRDSSNDIGLRHDADAWDINGNRLQDTFDYIRLHRRWHAN